MSKFISFKQLKKFLQESSTNVYEVGYTKTIKHNDKKGQYNKKFFNESCSGQTIDSYMITLFTGYGNRETYHFNDSQSIINYFNKNFNFKTMELKIPTEGTY